MRDRNLFVYLLTSKLAVRSVEAVDRVKPTTFFPPHVLGCGASHNRETVGGPAERLLLELNISVAYAQKQVLTI